MKEVTVSALCVTTYLEYHSGRPGSEKGLIMRASERVMGRLSDGTFGPWVRQIRWGLLLFVVAFCGVAGAQGPEIEKGPSANTNQFLLPPVDLKSLPKNLFLDQKNFWTAPFHMTEKQWELAVPLIIAGAALVESDRTIENHVHSSPSTASHAVTFSNAGVAGLAAAGGGLFLLGHIRANDQQRETGLLSGEAAIGAFLDTEIFKYASGRERPFVGASPGRFFVGGDSFPSAHASVSFAVASVIAHEYPGWLTQLLAYGAASSISVARVVGQKHFTSDVVIGGALGWYMGRQAFAAHSHYSSEDIARYGTFSRGSETEAVVSASGETKNKGSAYVPLDSWIYPALERLAALGYVESANLAMRPWTRLECSRQLSEATAHGAESDGPSDVQELYRALAVELRHEGDQRSGKNDTDVQLESIYTRMLGVSGRPLTDNFHFGQTLLNDYGRPFQQGFNTVDGASGWATAGPFVGYVRGEYQEAPSAPAPSQAELNFFQSNDIWPNGPALPVASINRFQLLDAYVGMNFANWQISFGRRSFWWGPSAVGSMALTNNATPLNNTVTVDRVTPFRLPWLFRYFGDIRFQGFISHLTGLPFQTTIYTGTNTTVLFGQYGKNLHPEPYLSGGMIGFRLTKNFEVNLTKTTVYGGPGNPLTITTWLDSTFGKHYKGDVLGDGRTTADFSYRIPGIRDWLSLYGEAFSEDEVSPIVYMRKSVSQGGLYFAKLPGIPRLDLRLEGGYTSPVTFCGACFYTNPQYNSGYTNDGWLMGTWIGRAAQGEAIRANYWLGARKKLGLELRHRTIDRQYLPQGGSQNDVAINADIFAKAGFRFTGNLQYERWQVPLLAPNRQNNLVASFQFSFWPTPHQK